MSGKEVHAIASKRGKWSVRGIPHKGWRCIDIEDLGSPSEICEMCESMPIRYAHRMEHPNYPGSLLVGCVCAGHMEENLARAQRRDKQMRSRASKRKRWLTRNWITSKKGNPYIEADGYRITIYPNGSNRWRVAVANLADKEDVQFPRRAVKTIDEAKLAAFDLVTSLLEPPADA